MRVRAYHVDCGGARGFSKAPLRLGQSEIECVEDFSYLGSLITSNGRVDAAVGRRIANASKAFGALHRAVFKDWNLNICTKRKVYEACVLSVLLYGVECWTPLRWNLRKLDAFHHRCVSAVLGITRHQQWDHHITSEQTRGWWRDPEKASTKVMKHRLQWLGHLARMDNHRVPKMAVWLAATLPAAWGASEAVERPGPSRPQGCRSTGEPVV